MDRDRSHRYLHAMGVMVWRLRGDDRAAADLTAGQRREAPPVSAPLQEARAGTQACGAPGFAGKDLSGTGAAAYIGPAPQHSPPTAALEPSCPVEENGRSDVSVGDMDWERLGRTVATCRACELCETRTQTVFGVGNRHADLMVIGEAPGADEDRQGEPFVGRAGKLLDLMLAAIGLAREQVYIGNILKCRPPGNRDPDPQEARRCKPYLMRQIALVEPRVLLCLGRISAQRLLETDTPIGKLRGRWFEFGPARIPLMVTYHPAYLLRSPEQKSKVWADLLQVVRRLRDESCV